jgi:hypothetical protein
MLKTIRSVGPQAPNANPWPIFAQMLPFFGVCALLVLVWILVDAILQDFILPPMAIEDAPIEGAFARWFALLRSDAGSVLVYLLLRFVVALGMSWVLMMVSLFVLLILGMGSFAVGFGLYHAMWQGGFGMQMVFGAIVAVMILVLLTLYLLAMVAVYGSTAVFKQAYAAYFFGSRYQELGDRLEPPAIESDAGVSTEHPLPALPPLNEPPPVW